MPGIGEQPLDVVGAEARDGLHVEPGEGTPVALALAQDRRPREAGLSAFEDQHLEEMAVVA